jgi:hypothetical protein
MGFGAGGKQQGVVLPIEMSSGIDREGQPRRSRRWVMSQRGNDLVRRYPWMAGLSAGQYNPAVRALYRRVALKHPDHKAIAIGHAMRKLLHLAFAVWKGGRPFDPGHYPWEGATGSGDEMTATASGSEEANNQAAGHKPGSVPAEKVVTAACADRLAQGPAVGEGTFIDFAHVGAAARQRGAAPLCLPNPPRRPPRADLQRQPPRQRLHLLRRALRQARRRDRPVGGPAPVRPAHSGHRPSEHLRVGASPRTANREDATLKVKGRRA